MSLRVLVLEALSIALIVLNASASFGQAYPIKPIRILTSGVGGTGDFVARQIAQGLSAALGQPVIVDNRNSSVLAAEVVSKAAADGYTLTVGGASLWVFPLLQKSPFEM